MKSKVEGSIRSEYDQQEPYYRLLSDYVYELLEGVCKASKWMFVGRVKDLESYALKLITGRTDAYKIDDFFACTIVVPNLRGFDPARRLIYECFDVIDERPGEYTSARPEEFNFDGIRIYCKPKSGVQQKDFFDLKFEVQIKTLLEYAWGEATHDFSYKGGSVSWAKERLAAQVKAVLNNADLSIFDMEQMANSKFLYRKNKKFERLGEVLEFLKTAFSKGENPLILPSDIKRLAEQVLKVLERLDVDLSVLEDALKRETLEGRGYLTRNLSIYSVVLVALYNQINSDFVRRLKKNSGNRRSVIVIPAETMISKCCSAKDFKDVVFLPDPKDRVYT